MTLDPSLASKFKAMNCAFVLDGNILTVEIGITQRNGSILHVKDAKRVKKQILAHYPHALCLTDRDRFNGLRVVADLL